MPKTHLITTGIYDNYQVVAQVTGPDRPALSTLYKQFRETYALPNYTAAQRRKLDWDTTHIHATSLSETAARKRMNADGLTGHSIAECFVNWLMTLGYQKQDLHEFHI